MSRVTIGILTYKRMDYLISLIKDLNAVKIKIDLIILNNNENIDVFNDIADILDSNFINYKYIWNQKNHGVSEGRRIIVENCNTDYLMLLDDDIYVEDINLICRKIINSFDSDKFLGAIAFNIIDFNTKKNNRYEIPHKNKKVNLNADFYTYLIIGAGLALRTSAVKDVGNFSNTLGPYGFEEIDVAFRLINAGYKIKYLHDCIIEHKKSPDGRFSNEMVNYYALVNRTILAKKYLRKKYFISCLVIRSLFFIVKTKNIRLLFKAWAEIIKTESHASDKFKQCFYDYCKGVSGFLYY
ncbi:glycosyltransferase family 2 protein [Escherichia coli]|jgi:GT2 family glycosyltransferase|uniref:Glycosyltransferase family 2 protein n=4 Tax=Bacteria TaxID=2 RepID=A0A5N8HB14_ECOLX|nr:MULTISPECIES: glycosyltransferase [Bacteria]ELJ0489694.1 glycosyltransferase family 2 protein [Escherichia coli O82]AYM23505.1 glycosyltransferase family 2 protein [Escherichia coli]EER3092919.1 glycosyltransferase family 2 protein [Escherichia coli]EEW2051242.1 glycosyltransferase family 2 protein [Escherichia coli]EFA6424474.1 glycosyltransferase family 2 protein [Escherichia coli]